MITVSVVSINGAAPSQPLSASFDETGGTIGRAEGNQLILPDRDRSVSRIHARIVFRNGRYAIVDCGSNPISVNQRTLGEGIEAPLNPGDRVEIGSFVLSVQAAQAQPFADVGGAAAGSAPSRAGASQAAQSSDPFAAFGLSSAPAPASRPSTSGAGGGGIPDDWDPFAPPKQESPRQHDLARDLGQRRDLGLELGGGAPAPLIEPAHGSPAAPSLDALFGLGASSGADPLAGSVLAPPIAAPNMAGDADPLRALGMVTPGSAASAPDVFSDLNRPFEAPPERKAAPQAPAPNALTPTPAAAPPVQGAAGVVLSWEDAPNAGHTVIRSLKPAGASPAAPAAPLETPTVMLPASATTKSRPRPAAGPTPAPTAAPDSTPANPLAQAPAATPAPAAAPSPSPAPAPAAPVVSVSAAAVAPPAPATAARSAPAAPEPSAVPVEGAEALRAAFLEGLGADIDIPALSPAFMRLVGELMRESTRGTVELLHARSALKREVRAEDATVIQVRENNGLKFSPDVDAGLRHLFGPPMRGFMAPVPSMRNAYDDLRAHQIAFLAGMRAALEGVLKRFAPASLEPKLSGGSRLSQLVPAMRKAQLWELFQGLYGEISREAEDDFHSLFGKEFLRAYEEHLERMGKDGEG